MHKTDDDAGALVPFAIHYGMLEGLLMNLVGGGQRSVASRFRKLRPKFAEDGLLTKPGNRVSYDLSRTLAICAIFQINAIAIPLGHAVELVVDNWPEMAEAFLHARSNEAEPKAVVQIYTNTFQEKRESDPTPSSWAVVGSSPPYSLPHVTLDCQLIVEELASLFERQDASLDGAFECLGRAFDRGAGLKADVPPVPTRIDFGFFGTGPYFPRARALLAAEDRPFRRGEAERLQAYLSYLEAPAPIDSWKRLVGTRSREPRLVHMLAARGVDLGLRSTLIGEVETLRAAASNREAALELIGSGEARLGLAAGSSVLASN